MATTGIMPGTLMVVYVDGVKIALLTTNSFSDSTPTRETANKDAGNYVTRLPNRSTWSASASAFYASSGSFKALKAKKDARATVVLLFSTGVTGDQKYTGNAYITELSADFPDDDNSTFNVSFEGDGQLSESDVT